MAKKNKNIDYTFVAFPTHILKSEEYAQLSFSTVKLLIDIFVQYKGFNNGDLSITWNLMSKCGWHSKATLERAKKELLAKGFIDKTRQGGRNHCSLYAVTWLPIDCSRDKIDFRESYGASNAWKNKKLQPKLGQCGTETGTVSRNKNNN